MLTYTDSHSLTLSPSANLISPHNGSQMKNLVAMTNVYAIFRDSDVIFAAVWLFIIHCEIDVAVTMSTAARVH